ncbi:hypothetical protein CERSUDRAFT_100121 [Gelatoporia subvermispora B]|uniref:Uncharacterized protein n=1 Tax=Ceriporiopsis subvermispora (strain B) TaxID=914234 RepID=M2R079_CERS8|nr:hypothetical protein CERSUDRAFT_100121 [Gelatoporia subvermispora B]
MVSIARPCAGIAGVVRGIIRDNLPSLDQQEEHERGEHPQTPPLASSSAPRQAPPAAPAATASPERHGERRTERYSESGSRSHNRKPSFSIPPPATPAGRSGPPRSLSFNYSLSPASHHRSLPQADGGDYLS